MPIPKNFKVFNLESIPVSKLLLSPAQLKCETGDVGMNNVIVDSSIYRPQLALAGYIELFTYQKIQLFGNTEMFYLRSLTIEQRRTAFETIAQFPMPCIIVTNNHHFDQEFIDLFQEKGIAVFSTPLETSKALYFLSEFLEDQFAAQVSIHASFVDVYGVGMLFIGRSGIGKSEIALDLVERGHRLVADDVVLLSKKRNILIGTGTSVNKHFVEVRGLGIIDIQAMFGIRAIRFQKRLEVIIELEEWAADKEYTRTGLDDTYSSIMDVDLLTITLPIFAGKNITVIAEVIALNYLLKTYNYNSAEIFASKLNAEIERKKQHPLDKDKRHISYFQSDEE